MDIDELTDEQSGEDAPRCFLTSPPRRAPDIQDIDPQAEAERVPSVPLDLIVRTAASAIEEHLMHADAPLAILQRFIAQLICDGPPEARDAALALLRASLELRGIDVEPADTVGALVRMGGV